MDLYAENILDHYRHPKERRRLASPSVTHEEINASCGDSVTIDLTITHGNVSDIGWDGSGCAISQAAMSMLAEDLAGKSVEEVEHLTKKDTDAMLGVPVGPRRFKCALLALHCLKNTLRKARGKPPQGWIDTMAVE